MQQQWSSFRITLLLYIIVLILPVSFYFVYSSAETIKNDTTIVRQSSWLPGAIDHVFITQDQQMVMQIDKTLNHISQWEIKNNDSKLYIGAKSLSEDLADIKACWKTAKKDLSATHNKCYNLTENMAVNIEKMVYMKQKEIINIFYISLLAAMALSLLMIYFVRAYIQQQIKKHAIYDLETNLFNRKYFLAALHTKVAKAQRENSPLSLFFFSLHHLDTYNAKQQKHLIQKAGHILATVTRGSDTVCRYDENHFAVLMPQTNEENALNLEIRLKKALESYDFQLAPEPKFSLKTTQLDDNETEEDFIARSKK